MAKDPYLPLVISFFAGIFLTTFLLLFFSVKKDRIRLLALPATLALIYTISRPYIYGSDYSILSFSVVFFALMVMPLFAEDILPMMTRYHILSYTIIFWYAFAVIHLKADAPPINPAVLALCVAGSAAAFFRSPSRAGAHIFYRVLLFSWHLGIVAFIGISQFNFAEQDFFSGPNSPAAVLPNPLEVFFSGMAFMSLLSNFALIETFVWAVTHLEMDLLESFSRKFRDMPLRPNRLAWTLLAQLALSVLNYSLDLIPHFFYINCCILAVPQIITWQVEKTARR